MTVVRVMQKRPEKRYANMREIAVALEGWLANHGYQFEPGSGEAAAKAAVLTAGGPAARKTGAGSLGGSRGSFSGSSQRMTPSGAAAKPAFEPRIVDGNTSGIAEVFGDEVP